MFTLRRMDNGLTSPQSMIDQFNRIISDAEQQIQQMQLGSDETQNDNENGQKDLSSALEALKINGIALDGDKSWEDLKIDDVMDEECKALWDKILG